MDNVDRISRFKNNPQNTNFFNHGNENISVNGDKNTVIKTTNIYNSTKIKNIAHRHNPDINISDEQQAILKEKVNKIGDMFKGLTPPKYQNIWANLNKKYKTPTYSQIKIDDFSDAVQYLDKQFQIYRKGELKALSATRFKEITIPLIHTRWNYLNKNEDLLLFASEKLNKPIMSLYTLSANDIDTLYTRVHSLKKRK